MAMMSEEYELTDEQIERMAVMTEQVMDMLYLLAIDLKTKYRKLNRELLDGILKVYGMIDDTDDPEYAIRGGLAVARGLIPLLDSLNQFESMLEAKGILPTVGDPRDN